MPKIPIVIQTSAKLLVNPSKGKDHQSLTPLKNTLSIKLLIDPEKNKVLESSKKNVLVLKNIWNEKIMIDKRMIKNQVYKSGCKPKLIPVFKYVVGKKNLVI